MGIRVRLTALVVAIFGLLFVLFSLLLYQYFLRSRQVTFDSELYNYAVDVSSDVDLDLFGELTLPYDPRNNGKGKILPFFWQKALIQLVTAEGHVVFRTPGLGHAVLPLQDPVLRGVLRNGFAFQTIPLHDIPGIVAGKNVLYRLISYRLDRFPSLGIVLQIAVPLTVLQEEQRELLTFFLFAIPAILIVSALGGLLLSRRALDPVKEMIRKAKEISATQLSERLPIPATEDELRELALTLNQLLHRLQNSFENQERFIADASHQLKTPLAIMRGELDVMRSRERTPEELLTFMASAAQEIEHLSKIVEDLLLLARVDAEGAVLKIERTRLDEIALEVISRLDFLAKKTGVVLKLNLVDAESYEIGGDPDLLKAMIHNLVENAIKFSPRGSAVSVTLFDGPETLTVSVKDNGPGITPEAMARIFNRFFRAENTQKTVAGSGLGLSIARRIAEIHGGKIEVESLPGDGAEFRATVEKRLKNF